MSTENILGTVFDRLQGVCFKVKYWTGRSSMYGNGEPEFTLLLRDRVACERMLANPSIGFGEAYASGAIEVDGDLKSCLRTFLGADLRELKLSWPEKIRMLMMRHKQRDTLSQAKRNIAHHYDVGNDFYQLWLGETMAYSCAYFKAVDEVLDKAQQQKFELICRKLRLAPDHRLLDIGCGWGGLLFHAAANYGVSCVGITISGEQLAYATCKAAALGLSNRITFQLKDYRELLREGVQFDRVVSVGMVEHVGKEFLTEYARCTRSFLKEGGLGVLQSIGRETSAPINSWIAKHVFPGMYLPTLDVLISVWRKARLCITDVEVLRTHYALTISRWHEGVEQHRREIEDRYGRDFFRMWTLYLASCEVGMRYGDLTLWQIQYTNGVQNDHPLTREHLYRGGAPGQEGLVNEVSERNG